MKIIIPKPCHENWETMTPEQKGRFCSVCSKTVRDFTDTSDEEIMKTFSNSSEDICGKFYESQINRDLQYSYINSLFTKFAVGFIITTGGFISVNAQNSNSEKNTNIKGKASPSINGVKKDTANYKNLILGGIRSVKIDDYRQLYVLDGKIIDGNQFTEIDPKSIKTMNILKGTSATSVYGEKGKNGVILITSKKKKGKF
ncbi:TonB-dependent receptor plug domain-containing protein [Chryseobacterium sp. Hurlbut01]|jgi:TonB-dependent SusC/RagA subfamily outer membrane receptor|uniref:TonB-dependent receptor plug domain-containing protein n=1 Tax=Chryseobacterium sp. Hurlbut01 TaxID=1681828 RepID=UPI00067B90C3|nr:TonB-dependent receptor plug domain-containing protein [Chryseobacterium sp. Hurlbut01]KNB60713.1 hypothetical protein AC804_16235 [Chryseobacterium sp. Hurlbut01]